ncbi:MAG TPA: GntR family transcriptional regulator [Luteimonas sp.]|jgi:GntR family transcriptional regulator|nr:GntR family transcriptional regulator [Luteimonas sp.]
MDAASFHIQPSAPEPIYRQIAEQVRRLVAGGQLAAGDVLPSVREVASTHAINPMTVSRAYSQLEAEGVLERLRGKGMAVAAHGRRHQQPLAQRWALLQPTIETLARQARELELDPDDVVARVGQRMRSEG